MAGERERTSCAASCTASLGAKPAAKTITRPRAAAARAASPGFVPARGTAASHCAGGGGGGHVGVSSAGAGTASTEEPIGTDPVRTGGPASPSVTRSRAQGATRAGLRTRGGGPPAAVIAHGGHSARPAAYRCGGSAGLASAPSPGAPASRFTRPRTPPRADTRSRDGAIQENVPGIVNRCPLPRTCGAGAHRGRPCGKLVLQSVRDPPPGRPRGQRRDRSVQRRASGIRVEEGVRLYAVAAEGLVEHPARRDTVMAELAIVLSDRAVDDPVDQLAGEDRAGFEGVAAAAAGVEIAVEP